MGPLFIAVDQHVGIICHLFKILIYFDTRVRNTVNPLFALPSALAVRKTFLSY